MEKNEKLTIKSNNENLLNNNFLKKVIYFNNYKKYIYIKFSLLNYSYSFKFNITKIEYNIHFYNHNNILVYPSELSYEYELNIICHIKFINGINIDSLANINLNKYYNCIEYFKINEKISFGIKIYKNFNDKENRTIYYFKDYLFNYNNFNYKNDIIFDPLYVENNFLKLLNISKINNTIKLKRSFFKNPSFNFNTEKDIWFFKNIYNQYYCFCRGLNCFYKNINKKCKYKFYLFIIDNNRYSYNKSYYLLADFLGENQSSDDSFPVFEELVKQNKNAFYMTKKKNIYMKYCKYNKKCKIIINKIYIDGNFLEKYLELILRLKIVIAGSEYLSIDNLFYNIEYITFISLTHGINYFKAFLYNNYYSSKKYNKIVTSSSNKIISLAMKYGWEKKNIIKICFPKWDKLNSYKKKYYNREKGYTNKKKMIFLFFTWRDLLKRAKISSYYFKNILNIINNKLLIKKLKDNKITMYCSLHHMLMSYRKKIRNINNNINFISQNQIYTYLMKSNLIITDFSSIIFDIIYQKKPFIIYIPDLDDPNITSIYKSDYCNIMNSLKNGTLYFENKYFNIKDVVNKIIYYIYNNFKLEKKLEKFYESFEFNCNNNTQNFLNYLEKI